MQASPFGRVTPSKSGTPPCKSGQLEKDLGLEVSSARQAARLIIFKVIKFFFVGFKCSNHSPSGVAIHRGETHGIFRTLAVSVSALLHFYFDCFWLRHRAFWQVNLQYAVFELSHDLGWIRIFGYGERTLKGAEEAFEPMEFSLLFFLLGSALAGNVKNAVFDCDFNVILLHLGQVSLEQILMIILGDVHQGRPIG